MSIMMRFPQGKSKAFTMSYDDGTYQDYRLVDILTKHGIKATFNISSGRIGRVDACKDDEKLTPKQIKELYMPLGHEVALHSYSHAGLLDMPIEQVTYEYIRDKEVLEDILGIVVRGSAYPYSKYNQKVIQSLKSCGIAYARGGDSTWNFNIPTDWLRFMPTVRHKEENLFDLTENFLNLSPGPHQQSALFCLMGHSHEFWRDNNWDLIENFAEKISGQNDIWYATNIEIYDYIHSFNEIRFNLAMTLAENPTSTDVWICKGSKTYELKSGTTTVITE